MLKRSKQHADRQRQRRHQRHQHQQDIGRDVGEHHGVDQADLPGQPASQQRRNPGQDIGPEKDAAEDARLDPKADMEPVGDHALDDQSAAESVQSKQSAQAQHHAAAAVQAEGAPGFNLPGTGRDFDRGGDAQEQYHQDRSTQGISHQNGAVRVQHRHAAALQDLGQPAACQRAGGSGERAGQVIPGKGLGAAFIGDQLGQPGLLDRQEWANLVPAGADHADDGGRHQEHGVFGQDKDDPCPDHQQGAQQ